MNFKEHHHEERTITPGVSFTGLLTIAFIVLKLLGVINWSWVWVLSPIWIPIAFVLFITIIAFLLVLIID